MIGFHEIAKGIPELLKYRKQVFKYGETTDIDIKDGAK